MEAVCILLGMLITRAAYFRVVFESILFKIESLIKLVTRRVWVKRMIIGVWQKKCLQILDLLKQLNNLIRFADLFFDFLGLLSVFFFCVGF